MQTITVFCLVVCLFVDLCCLADDSPGFFLKVTKNIPRLGRRSIGSGYEEFLLNNAKNIPRIERSDHYVENYKNGQKHWYDNLSKTSKRLSGHPKENHLMSYNVIRPLDSNDIYNLISEDILFGAELKFIQWRDFDRALQQDEDLFMKLMSIGQDPGPILKTDLEHFVPLYSESPSDELFYMKIHNELEGDNNQEKTEYQF